MRFCSEIAGDRMMDTMEFKHLKKLVAVLPVNTTRKKPSRLSVYGISLCVRLTIKQNHLVAQLWCNGSGGVGLQGNGDDLAARLELANQLVGKYRRLASALN